MARLAVVSGGSSGIGRATAVALGRAGWRVVLVARGQAALEEAAAEVGAAGGQAEIAAIDAADPEAVESMARGVIARSGPPDAVVNSAGFGEWRFIEEAPAATGGRLISAPYLAAYHLTAAFMGAMLSRRSGVFVHVGSPASLTPWPGATAYTAARWALRGLHEALCADLHGTGLRSCHVLLGEVRTAYFQHATDSHDRIPLVGRWIPVMEPAEAGAIVASVVERPRRQVVRPRLMGAFAVLHHYAPWIVERAVWSTGARRRIAG